MPKEIEVEKVGGALLGSLRDFAAFFTPGAVLAWELAQLLKSWNLEGIYNNEYANLMMLVVMSYLLGALSSVLGSMLENALYLLKDDPRKKPNPSLLTDMSTQLSNCVSSGSPWMDHYFYYLRTYVRHYSPRLSSYAEREDNHRLMMRNCILPITLGTAVGLGHCDSCVSKIILTLIILLILTGVVYGILRTRKNEANDVYHSFLILSKQVAVENPPK